MRLPYENYIRFLITSGLDLEETNESLEELGLGKATPDYWNRQYEILHNLKIPKKIKKFWKNPTGKVPNGFFEYMNVAGLKDAWLYNCDNSKYFSQMIDVMSDPNITLILQAMTAVKASLEEISSIVNGKFAIPFHKESIRLFQIYFFDTKIMSRTSWKIYLKDLPSEDRNVLYLGLVGEDLELRALLGLPTKISVSENYQKLHIFSMTKFMRYSKAGVNQSDSEALKWAKMAMDSGDRYEKLKVSDATDFVRDIQMEFDQIDTDFPTIGEDDLEEIKSNKDAGKNNDAADPIPLQVDDEDL